MSSTSRREYRGTGPIGQFAVLWLDPRAASGTFTVPFVHGDAELKWRLAHAIKAAREEAGLTRPQLAKGVGVSRNAVLAWEKGTSVPSMLNLGGLADTLEVSADLFAHPPPVPESSIARWRLQAVAEQAADLAVDEALGQQSADVAPARRAARAKPVKR